MSILNCSIRHAWKAAALVAAFPLLKNEGQPLNQTNPIDGQNTYKISKFNTIRGLKNDVKSRFSKSLEEFESIDEPETCEPETCEPKTYEPKTSEPNASDFSEGTKNLSDKIKKFKAKDLEQILDELGSDSESDASGLSDLPDRTKEKGNRSDMIKPGGEFAFLINGLVYLFIVELLEFMSKLSEVFEELVDFLSNLDNIKALLEDEEFMNALKKCGFQFTFQSERIEIYDGTDGTSYKHESSNMVFGSSQLPQKSQTNTLDLGLDEDDEDDFELESA